MSKYNLTEIFNESFDSLAKKLDKQKGIDKDDAAKIAGSIAAKKMKGAGSGPTAKQKARVKEEEVSDKEQVFDVIYAAGGKDVAPDFMDAIGEEFGIDFKYGRVNEQSKPINELAPDVRNRIEGLINRRFKYDFLMDFIKIYSDITQDDPFDSEDILEYFEEEMRKKLKEQEMYMDNFNPDPDNMKESIKEGDFDDLKKYQKMMNDAADFFRDKAEKLDVDNKKIGDFNKGVNDLVKDVFDADYKMSGGKINEDEEEEEEEEVVQYEPFVEGETILRKSEVFDGRYDYYYSIGSEKEYDFLLKYGVDDYLSEYAGGGGAGVFTPENLQVYRDNEKVEYSMGNDYDDYDLTPIQEDLFSKDGGSEDNVDNIDTVASPSAKGRGYNQVSKANTAEDDMESKETLNPKPMYEDLKKHFKRFI